MLPDKNGVLYTVTRDEPTSAHTSLGVKIALNGGQVAVLGVDKDEFDLFAAQMKTTQCDKTSCLNCFNTSSMPSLSYKMIATQFTEQHWNYIISPVIQATLNATGIVGNLVHSVLYGPEDYQGLVVKNPFFYKRLFTWLLFLTRLCVIPVLVNS